MFKSRIHTKSTIHNTGGMTVNTLTQINIDNKKAYTSAVAPTPRCGQFNKDNSQR